MMSHQDSDERGEHAGQRLQDRRGHRHQPNSWDEAAKNAVEKVATTVQDLRVAEVVEFDMKIEADKVTAYRARVKVSFKYHDELND